MLLKAANKLVALKNKLLPVPSVGSILAGFSKTVSALDNHAARKTAEAAKHYRIAEEADAKAEAACAEASRAEAVKARIEALLG